MLTLSVEELAFFRLTCDLFPRPESPLRFIEDEGIEPEEIEQTFDRLTERGLLNESRSGASPAVHSRLEPVAECSARVLLRRAGGETDARSFYLNEGVGVEYARQEQEHRLGEPRKESALAIELTQLFVPSRSGSPARLNLSAGDYLVFAVFARDAKSQPEAGDEETPMSVDEVLSYFEEPETKYLRTPSDESWQASVKSLCDQGVLVQTAQGYELTPVLHNLARELAADNQHTIVRFDFLDEHWLVREVSLYPTEEATFRVGTDPDGSVAIQELDAAGLADVMAEVVTTLPNLLESDVQAVLT